ncbi:MAG: rhomboid family intramembrane serine protease [Gemmatimonadetes bacterium]|nr:MAG: rhomboid family intramembrane serine protease [Gemmatimonadota bacterium]
MFPLQDDNPTELPPIVTMGIIAACVVVWIYVQGAGFDERLLRGSVCALGAVPAEITGFAPRPGPFACRFGGLTWGALVTSMFLHGSWMHLIGNMWFLWIFGNNIEDSMGHLRFLVFYVATGVIAALGHVITDPASALPIVGASGAISAVMGAYLVLYPRARVATLFFFLFFIRIVEMPAVLFLGFWFLLQLMSGMLQPPGTGGVAFWAHIAGFVAGVVLVFAFRDPRLVRAKRAGIRLPPGEIPYGGWF